MPYLYCEVQRMDFKYFDNAATTRVDQEILKIISLYNTVGYYNPSANYLPAVEIHNQVSEARESILRLLKGFGGTLYFLSSGTEGDNQALVCSKKRKNSNIVISAAEHPAVYQTANYLKNCGYEVRICPVLSDGRVKTDEFSSLIDENTSLVSVMHVNNETGGINDIRALVSLAKGKNPGLLFHSDGVQAFGKIPVNLADLGVDLYTISGHKIGAPKGIAGLFVKKGVTLSPLLYGGGQEGGLRSSTENVAGIMAFAHAANRAIGELPTLSEKYRSFAEIIKNRLSVIEELRFLSDSDCSPHILTFAFCTVRGEVMQHALESKGYLVGTGSACSSTRSHERIPKALELKEYADGILRVSFGRETTSEDVLGLAEEIVKNYEILKKYVGK